MPGHFHSGLHSPLPGPLGGEGIHVHDAGIRMHASPEVADQDRDPGYETQDKLSYPILVVVSPPSDRLSAVVSPTQPAHDDSGSAVDSQVSIAPSTAIMVPQKRPRLVLQVAPAADPIQDLVPATACLRTAPAVPPLDLIPSGSDHPNGQSHPDGLSLPLADEPQEEPREIPWGGILPP